MMITGWWDDLMIPGVGRMTGSWWYDDTWSVGWSMIWWYDDTWLVVLEDISVHLLPLLPPSCNVNVNSRDILETVLIIFHQSSTVSPPPPLLLIRMETYQPAECENHSGSRLPQRCVQDVTAHLINHDHHDHLFDLHDYSQNYDDCSTGSGWLLIVELFWIEITLEMFVKDWNVAKKTTPELTQECVKIVRLLIGRFLRQLEATARVHLVVEEQLGRKKAFQLDFLSL